jgi:2-(1,2-epoxy-1,2-dihydrophenyl)acetyl-CoA isomerase
METIEVTRDGGIVTVTLARPEKKNAVNTTMWRELRETFIEIGDRSDDRVMILTGKGREFCSGADLSGGGSAAGASDGGAGGRAAAPVGGGLGGMRLVGDTCLALFRINKPTIAKVDGVAVGAGANMAFACDLVVASEEARFSEIFARRGLSVDFGGSWLLPRLVGLHKAKELVYFAEIFSSKEALEIGLVNRVVPAAELDAFVAEWATRLAAGPPIALAQSKRMLNNSMSITLDVALEEESTAQTVNFGTADTMEAMMAFLEKRTPNFQGR